MRKDNNRTDRVLVLIALILLLIASGLFYFDSWMWGGKRDRGDVIGLIAKKSGDVRLKFDGELKWQRAGGGDNLVFNDAVYAGSGSEAQLNLGESKMTVTENTLVVLRRQDNTNFMNLNYGTLFGKVAKNDRLVIDTGSGKPLELSTASGANVILHKTGGSTQLEVTSGTAEIIVDGKKRKIDSTDRVVFGDKFQISKTTGNKIKILKPLRDQTIYSEDPAKIDFAWTWDVPRLNRPEDRYTLEFSADPTFGKIHATKVVPAAFSTSMNVSKSLNLYYRIRGPGGALSQTERVKFVRITKPIIIEPVANQKITTPDMNDATVNLEFGRPEGSSVWYQIANYPDFKTVLINKSTAETKASTQLPLGQYSIRARGDYGERMTAWTDPVPFTVQLQPELKLTRRPPTKIYIPNREYPTQLYGASDKAVRDFLVQREFLKDYFRLDPGTFDYLAIEYLNGGKERFTQRDGRWPNDKLQPGRYQYRYQIAKEGNRPSPWSDPNRLEILDEAPRPVGEAEYGNLDRNSMADARWRFTPLLFAASYDVEVATEPTFQLPMEFKTRSALAETRLSAGQAYFWRARARDRTGKIISEYSEPYRLKPMSQVPQMLARNGADRQPAATERVKTKVERVKDDDWIHNGWWAWIGAGMNYTKYQQSTFSRATFDAPNTGFGQYFETGYTGDHGWGGVFSYKRTPGEVILTDQDAGVTYTESYLWSTFSLEGIMRRLSSFKLFGRPLLLGFRSGLQIHKTPFVFVDENGTPNLKQNDMTTASLGVLAELNRRRWNYYWLMRYQFPLSTQSDGASQFDISPKFAFDGSVGLSYSLNARTRLGMFWYGQWHQYNFTYSDGSQVNEGFQSLFYSNMDLRLGIDF